MKLSFKNALVLLPAALALSFTLVFFGYLRPVFNIVLHMDAIQGEGNISIVMCAPQPFSPYYTARAQFGNELEELELKDVLGEVRHLKMTASGFTSFEVDSYDVIWHGLKIGHYEPEQNLNINELPGMTLSLSEDGQKVHFDFTDPDTGAAITINTHFPTWWLVAIYAALVLLLGAALFLVMLVITNRLPVLRLPVASAGGVLIALLAGAFFCGSFAYMEYTYLLLNWVFLFAAALLLNALTLPFLGSSLVMGFSTLWYIANYYVIQFRSKPIMPADLKAIGTAAEVMGAYNFMPSWQMIVGVAAVIAYIVLLVLMWRRETRTEKKTLKRALLQRGATAVAAVLVVIIGVNTGAFRNLDTFAWDAFMLQSFHKEGIVLSYMKLALNSRVAVPEGYSREQIDAWLDEYRAAGVETPEGVQPTRIIMVMNEAFSDLRTVGLDERIDVMPFIDSLDENVVEGSLYVSVYGGGTCNTEFEALTGNTLAFLGVGSYPYAEYVTEPLFSLASYFRDAGYLTEAFHANLEANWNRNRVYPNIGFSDFHSIEDYSETLDEVPYLHSHPADAADYAYIEQVDAEKEGQPRFLFNVTMQNHSGYERWEDVEKSESVLEYGAGLSQDTQVYLSLVQASDEAVRQLVETYRDSEEPTMIVFFGDHQPGLPDAARDELYAGLSNFIDSYKSKFFIWTNYETVTAHDVGISANYLPYLILKLGNFPIPPYIQMLGELHEAYPIVSAMGVVDSEGNLYGSVNELPDDPLLTKYRHIQYANLFDELDEAWFHAE